MSDSKQPGSGKIIRTSSGSTRLTAGSSKSDEKPAAASGSGSNSGSGANQGSGSGRGSSGPNSQNATVVAPPPRRRRRSPTALPRPVRHRRLTGSQGSGAPDRISGSGAPTSGSQGSGSQGSGGGNRTATSVMGNAANTVAPAPAREDGREEHGRGRKGQKKKGPRTVRLTVSAVDPGRS